MKKATYLLLLAIFAIACKPSTDNKGATISTEKLEKQGFQLLEKEPRKAIAIFDQVSQGYLEEQNHKKVGLTYLNIANIYDEYLNIPDTALIYASKSLGIWNGLQDTIQQANLYKYSGLLKGKLGKYRLAKEDISRSIAMYQLMNFTEGATVAEVNLANICLQEGSLPQCKFLFDRTTKYWKETGNMDRVFTNNILGIEVSAKLRDKNRVNELIEENTQLMSSIKMNDYLRKRFEEVKAMGDFKANQN